MTVRITIESTEPEPAAWALARETVRNADELSKRPAALWNASTRIKDEAFDFLVDALVGMRLDGATEEECDGLCRFVFAIIERTQKAARRHLEETESYRIDEEGCQ